MPKQEREWVSTLPPRRPKTYDWYAITEELREHPGEWTLLDGEASISLQGAINKQRMTALRSDEWDYNTRTYNNNRETGTCELWMSATRKEG